jgi:ribonuclease E
MVDSVEPAAASAPEPAAPKRARHKAGASEPRLERIVVGEESAAAHAQPDESTQPARKGWWQRRLSGE